MTSSPAPVSSPAGLTHRQVLVVFVGLMTGMSLAALDGTIVNTALPTIVGEFGGLDHISWVGTAYLLTSVAATPLFGKLSDIYGRRSLFQAAIVVFMIGSVACGIAQSLLQLVLARGLQGIGGGGLQAMGLVIIGDVVSPRERGRYTALMTGVFAVAAVAGPLLGGFFVDQLNWRWSFFINLPLGLVALVVTTSALRLPYNRTEHSVDWLGAALLVPAVTCLLLVAVWGGTEHGWTSPTIVGLGVTGVVLSSAFLLQEHRAPEPILPLRLFSNSIYTLGMIISVIAGALLYSASTFLPLYLQTVTGASATASGMLMLPLMGGLFLASIVGGRILVRTGRYRRLPLVGLGVASVGVVLLAMLDASTTRTFLGVGMFCVGLGLGLTNPTITVAVQNAVDQRDMGSATASVSFFRALGGALGLAALGAVVSAQFRAGLVGKVPTEDIDGYLSSPSAIVDLAEPLRGDLTGAMADAVGTLFLATVPLVLIAWALAWFIRELPLRTTSYVHADAEPSAALH